MKSGLLIVLTAMLNSIYKVQCYLKLHNHPNSDDVKLQRQTSVFWDYAVTPCNKLETASSIFLLPLQIFFKNHTIGTNTEEWDN